MNRLNGRNRSNHAVADRTTVMGHAGEHPAQRIQRGAHPGQQAQRGAYFNQGAPAGPYDRYSFNRNNQNVTFDYSGQDEYAGFNSAYDAARSKTNRMANKAIVVFVGFIFVIIVGIALVMLWPNDAGDAERADSLAGQDAAADESLLDGLRNGVLNYVIDVSGAKDKVESALLQSQAAIRDRAGMTSEEFATAMDSLAIQEWRAATLPEDSVQASSIDLGALGVDATVTTYQDPSYVTVTFLGQDITMSVPESAQPYMPLLGCMA